MKVKKIMRVRQRDPMDCGAACIASVCAFHGHHISVSRVRQYAGTDRQGTSMLGLVKAAEKLGMTAKGVRALGASLQGIPLPAIAHVVTARQLSHFVVLVRAHKKEITVMDPATGRFRRLAFEAFRASWTGVLVLMLPGQGFMRTAHVPTAQKFLGLIRPHRSMLIYAFICAVLASLLGLVTSLYLKQLADRILPAGDTGLLDLISLAAIVLLASQSVLGILRDRLAIITGQRVDAKLVMGYIRHLLRLPQRFLDTMQPGELISRVNDAVRISIFVNEVLINLAVNTLALFFSITLMFLYNWKLALAGMLVIPFYLGLLLLNDRITGIWERRVMEAGAGLESQLVESLSATDTVKRFRLEESTAQATQARLTTLLKNTYRSSMYQLYIHFSADLVTKAGMMLTLWTGSYYVLNGSLSNGELLSFYALLSYFTAPVLHLLGAGKSFRDARIASDRLFEIMDLETESSGKISLDIEKGSPVNITFNEVSFGYGNGEKVLKNISFTISTGSVTGITGESGCGKSTLAALLQNLYQPDAGTICINGTDLQQINNDSIRSLIVSVPQHTCLFSGTISENITLGLGEPDVRKMQDISEKLGISEFIHDLPLGYDTFLHSHGANLSGGQKQKISIARALYREPAVLIMDEATASADTASENQIMSAMDWYRKQGNTVIVIAHRPSTLRFCDNILVIENGGIK